jgi:hypothetical protein
MLETKLGSRRVILGLKRAFERAARTHNAVVIQQRVAHRTRSSLCGFHSPGLGCHPTLSSANWALSYIGCVRVKITLLEGHRTEIRSMGVEERSIA